MSLEMVLLGIKNFDPNSVADPNAEVNLDCMELYSESYN